MDFEDIYNTYVNDVYHYVLSLCRNSYIAEDVTSETFLKAINNVNRFRGDCSLRVWLCQIAKNTYYNFQKQKKYIIDTPDDISSEDDFELRLIDKTLAFEIHKILRNLDEPYKDVFSLRIFAELSFQEIGELYKKSDGWARVSYHRAKNKIKETIEND